MQGAQIQSLVGEDSTCIGTTKPVSHNFRGSVPQLLKPVHLEPVLCHRRSPCNEKSQLHNKEWLLLPTTRESTLIATGPKIDKNKIFLKKKENG